MKTLFNYTLLIFLLCTSCSNDDNSNKEPEIENAINKIEGSWTDDFGDTYTITSSGITIVSSNNNVTYTFHTLTNGNNYAIYLNDSGNPFNANLYSKFVFTNISTNSFNLCQPFYDSPSQAFIENSADPTNPNDLDTGCIGFSWSKMIRN